MTLAFPYGFVKTMDPIVLPFSQQGTICRQAGLGPLPTSQGTMANSDRGGLGFGSPHHRRIIGGQGGASNQQGVRERGPTLASRKGTVRWPTTGDG